MGRRSGGGGGGFRSAPRARTPAPAKPAAAPAKPAAAPAPAPANNGSIFGGGGGFLSNLGEGMSWGFGSSIGHRIADAFAGPRTIRVVEAPPSEAAPAAAAADACGSLNQAFADCINMNGSDISRCQFYLDQLNDCRRQPAAATTPIPMMD